MRTQKQIEASRANGRKSKGPVTPEGKRISSQNSRTHGLLTADAHTLKGDDLRKCSALRDLLLLEFPPQCEDDDHLLDEAAFSLWHMNRGLEMEEKAFGDEILRLQAENPGAAPEHPAFASASAFRSLVDRSGFMEAVIRYSVHFERRFDRAMSRLKRRQNKRKFRPASRPAIGQAA